MKKDDTIRKGKGYGFKCDDGPIAMQRCFECGKENYASAVSSGRCAWCGFDANANPSIKKGHIC